MNKLYYGMILSATGEVSQETITNQVLGAEHHEVSPCRFKFY